MAIDEARDDESSVQIDDMCLGPSPALDLGVRTDSRDPVTTYRDRLSAWLLRVDGEHVAMEKHEIGTMLRARRVGGQGNEKEDEAGLENGQAPVE